VRSSTISSPCLPSLASLGARSTAVDSYVCRSSASEDESEAGAVGLAGGLNCLTAERAAVLDCGEGQRRAGQAVSPGMAWELAWRRRLDGQPQEPCRP
jgi:hypothetical protein